MRRALLPLALLLVWPAAAHAARATVKVTDCVPAVDPVERSATFEARIRAIRASDRMQVRFALQVRDEGIAMRWRKVEAPGFDTWITSASHVRRYSYTRTIQNLSAPAAYRTVVRFRWLDADGEKLRARRVRSAACGQPDARPNLVPLRAELLDAATGRYRLTVRNTGRTAAEAFDVALGDATVPVDGLDAGAQRAVVVSGPPCTAPQTFTVDAADAVDERDETDNALVVPCR